MCRKPSSSNIHAKFCFNCPISFGEDWYVKNTDDDERKTVVHWFFRWYWLKNRSHEYAHVDKNIIFFLISRILCPIVYDFVCSNVNMYPFQRKLWNLCSFGFQCTVVYSVLFARYYDCFMNKTLSSLNHHTIVCICILSSIVFFSSHIPEKFFPGKFDILGQGHQIFHVFNVRMTIPVYTRIDVNIWLNWGLWLVNSRVWCLMSIMAALNCSRLPNEHNTWKIWCPWPNISNLPGKNFSGMWLEKNTIDESIQIQTMVWWLSDDNV
jgi:hypothetical protein